jgi:hypothetical protein
MYLGNGMIMTDCQLCAQDDNHYNKICAPTLDKIDRRSKEYRDAINEIMRTSECNRVKATQIFDKTYSKS